MTINSFSAKGVNGYLEFDMKFDKSLTFLTGINGSGKTSVLKLVLGLISPSLSLLSQINFTAVKLVCSVKLRGDIQILAYRNDDELEFQFKPKGGQILKNKIKIFSLNSNQDGLTPDERNAKNALIRQQFEDMDSVKAIRKLATPIFLGLDRKIYEGRRVDRERTAFFTRSTLRASSNDPLNQSLAETQELVFSFVRKMAKEQPRIADVLKEKVMRESFNFIESDKLFDAKTINYILNKKKSVDQIVENLETETLKADVEKFFEKLVQAQEEINAILKTNPFAEDKYLKSEKKAEESRARYIKVLSNLTVNLQQIKRFDEITKFNEEYKTKLIALREPIQRLEKIVAAFFKEAGKKLKIGDDGEIKIFLPNGKETTIYDLSSGEKQILIMITHLIFYEDTKESGVFIIDEPELSLHLAWQQIFVDAVLIASPKTQFIMATHSPSIIARPEREKNCEDVTKLNRIRAEVSTPLF